MLPARETDLRTLRVTLFLCAACGFFLQASAGDLRAGECFVSTARAPRDPADVFGDWPAAPRVWERKQIANCKTSGDGIEKSANSGPSNLQSAICNTQYAIPFDRSPAPDSDWLHLVDNASSSSEVGFAHDLRGFLPGVWRDAKGVVRTENMLILGVALGAAIGIRQDLDDRVRHDTAANPDRWGEVSHTLGKLGEAPIQVPLLAVLWGTSVWMQDAELNSFAHAVVSAYTINGLSVLAIKAVTDTDRPDPDWNDGRWGFPSFHAASTFAIAGVVEEYYGWPAALPAYTLAGLISWSRIDERDHDLSDVVFGAAMGWVIGKSVAGTHLRNDGRVLLMPWSHPYEPAQGVALEVRY